MKSVIIFGSEYGSSRQYAKMLSQHLQIECFDYKAFNVSVQKTIFVFDWICIMYHFFCCVGSVYMGC